jgi:hypothetical protein
MLFEIGDQHIGAFPGESDRDRAADPGIGARDQRRTAFELAAALIGLLAVIRARVELAGLSRRLLLLRIERGLGARLSRIVVAHGSSSQNGSSNPNGRLSAGVPTTTSRRLGGRRFNRRAKGALKPSVAYVRLHAPFGL